MPIYGPGEGEDLGNGIVIKATRDTTDGQFFMSEASIPPGFEVPPHYHETLHDMFYVLEGTLTLLYDGEEREAGPGTFALVPPGIVHAFFNRSDAPVRLLNLSVPGGFEDYMRELAGHLASGDATTPGQIGKIAMKYDMKLP
ncbi:MAG TPA: cupin domain-containing protein [Solirubrobacteraceae bacterium]